MILLVLGSVVFPTLSLLLAVWLSVATYRFVRREFR